MNGSHPSLGNLISLPLLGHGQGRADWMERPPLSNKGEGVGRSLRLDDPKAEGQREAPHLCLVMKDGCLVAGVS